VAHVHLGLLRQVARLRRRQSPSGGGERAGEGSGDRLRDAEDARSRADAQRAAASARRNLEGGRRE
jgi:hypothetical protein